MWIYLKRTYLKCIVFILLFLFLSMFSWSSPNGAFTAYAQEKNQHIVLVLTPDLSFNELDWILENSKQPSFWKGGAYGAINLRPDGPYSYLNNMVSISTGTRSLGVKDWNAYEQGEELDGIAVESLFYQWRGREISTALLHPHFHRLKAKAASSSFRAEVGSFGEKLKLAGIYSTVFGNSDTREQAIRYGSLIVMDQNGGANGELHTVVDKNKLVPGGLLTNKQKLVEKVIKIQEKYTKSFIVIEWGDLHRLFSEREYIENGYFEKRYQQTLLQLEETLVDIGEHTKGEVWLLSPNVNREAYQEKNQLGPIWVWKKDRGEKFELYSPTTRKKSLISNTDLINTWLETFQLDKVNASIGHPLQIKESTEWSYEDFNKRIQEINAVFKGRAFVLSTYVSILVILLIFVSIIMLFFKEVPWRTGAKLILLSAVLSPLLFLLTSPSIRFFDSMLYVAFLTILSVLIAFFTHKLTAYPFSIACFTFVVTMCIDFFYGGGYLIERSFLGYDPVIGARFYGIGNEYAGIFIASTILMLSPLIRLEKRMLTFITLTVTSLFLIVILGASSLGANAGASLAVVIMLLFIIFQLVMEKYPVYVKAIIAVIFIFIMLATLYFLQLAQPTSHISLAFQQLLDGNLIVIWDLIIRKLQMNWKIFKISYWTQLFVTSYLLIGIMLWRRKKEELTEEKAFLIQCMIVASIGLLLLNDSGIVAAATSMFITISVYYGWKIKMSH